MNIVKNIKRILFYMMLLLIGFNCSAKSFHSKKCIHNKLQSKNTFWKGLQWGSIINFENDTVNEDYLKENALLYDVNFVFSHVPIDEGPVEVDTANSKKLYIYFSFMMPEDSEALKAWKSQYSYVGNKNDSEVDLEPFATTDNDSINPFSFGMSYRMANDSIFIESKRGEFDGDPNSINGLWKMQKYNMVFISKESAPRYDQDKLGDMNNAKAYDYLNNFKSKDKGIMYIYVEGTNTAYLKYYYWIENKKLYLLNKSKNYLMVLPYSITNNGMTLNYIIKEHEMPKSIVDYIDRTQASK